MSPVEWHRRVEFAEVAEALGVETDLVFGTQVAVDGVWTVLYSPDGDEPERVFGVLLRRDTDGVLRQIANPRELPGFADDLKRRFDDAT